MTMDDTDPATKVTLRQFLAHLRVWLRMFPNPWGDIHTWVGVVDYGDWECWGCGAIYYNPDDGPHRPAEEPK
jgi:hypothetical protein